MKLINDFFKVLERSESGTGSITTIALNPGHIVYAGHFPGFPVTPGVIQMQIVHELLAIQFGRKLKLKTMPLCKFLKVLNPKETAKLEIRIEYTRTDEMLDVKATGKNDADVFFKLQATYIFDASNPGNA